MPVTLFMADCDDIIVMNIIKFENFAVRKHAIGFNNILCLTTKKMLPPPLPLSHVLQLCMVNESTEQSEEFPVL